MTLFSERYKYVTHNEALIREDFPKEIANGVCSCFDYYGKAYNQLEERTITLTWFLSRSLCIHVNVMHPMAII